MAEVGSEKCVKATGDGDFLTRYSHFISKVILGSFKAQRF